MILNTFISPAVKLVKHSKQSNNPKNWLLILWNYKTFMRVNNDEADNKINLLKWYLIFLWLDIENWLFY